MRMPSFFARLGLVAVSLCLLAIATACATVDVTKTAKGHHEPTDPNDVAILMTVPDSQYVELGTVTTTRWNPSQTAKMHNALRAKTAPLGANAVILTDTGRDVNGYLWANGVAIRIQ